MHDDYVLNNLFLCNCLHLSLNIDQWILELMLAPFVEHFKHYFLSFLRISSNLLGTN